MAIRTVKECDYPEGGYLNVCVACEVKFTGHKNQQPCAKCKPEWDERMADRLTLQDAAKDRAQRLQEARDGVVIGAKWCYDNGDRLPGTIVSALKRLREAEEANG